MPFQKGHPRYGGKRKGSLHKKTKAIRERLLRDEQLTVESTVEAIRRGQNFDIRRLYHDDGRLKELHELTEEEAWPIVGIEIVRENLKGGDGHSDTVLKYKLDRRLGYVDLAARHQGMLTERVELVGLSERKERLRRALTRTPKP
jgi:hypothetical protein